MLKIAQKTDLALLIVTALARNSGEGRVSLEELARKAGVSHGYLEQVAGALRHDGIVHGRRGAHGGYELARPATEITLANLVTAMEGASWASECIGELTAAGRTPRSRGNAAVWRRVQGQIMATLHGTTVADVLRDEAASNAV